MGQIVNVVNQNDFLVLVPRNTGDDNIGRESADLANCWQLISRDLVFL